MKICFFLQRRFAYMGHAMLCHLKTRMPELECCGVVQVRAGYEFLKNQNDIQYTSLLLEEDFHAQIKDEVIDHSYLAFLEKEYGIPNLWPYLYIDRVIMSGQLVREYPYDTPSLSHEDMLRLLQITARELLRFLDEEKPSVVVFSVVGSLGSMLLYHMAKKRGIQTLAIELARIENRIILSEDYRTFTWASARFKELVQDPGASPQYAAAQEFLRTFRANPAPYNEISSPTFNNQVYRSSNLRFLRPDRLFKSAAWHAKSIVRDTLKKERDYSDIPTHIKMWDKFLRRARGLRGYNDLYEAPRQDEPFAYYPLHTEPEIATLLLAPYYTDQRAVIRAAARALPADMMLYVKEHPEMVGYRTREYYREIAKIPNVRLINPAVPGSTLARQAAITITITGTSGWESCIFGKPVIAFGDVFFNDLSSAARCRLLEELPYLVKEYLEKTPPEKELEAYVCAIMEDSVAVNYLDMWNAGVSVETLKNDTGMHTLAELIAAKAHA